MGNQRRAKRNNGIRARKLLTQYYYLNCTPTKSGLNFGINYIISQMNGNPVNYGYYYDSSIEHANGVYLESVVYV